MNKALFIVSLSVLALNQGCATITQGTIQQIQLQTSEPCTVNTKDGVQNVSPPSGVLTVKKSKDSLNIACASTVYEVKSKVSKRALIGGMLLDGGIIDMLTGAFWVYPESVNLENQTKE